MNTLLAWGLVGFLAAALVGGFIEMRLDEFFLEAVMIARHFK